MTRTEGLEEKVKRSIENIEEGIVYLDGNKVRFRKSLANEHNRATIIKFIDELSVNGRTAHTRLGFLRCLHSFAEFLGNRNFEEVAREDVLRFLLELQRRSLKKNSVEGFKWKIISFYKWFRNGEKFEECASWLKSKREKNPIVSPEKILSEEEVLKLVEVADNSRDKALITFLYESACRIGEVLGIRIKDLVFDDFGLKVRVSGKTGERTIRVVSSVPYIKEWLKKHPKRDDPEAFLFVINSRYNKYYNGVPLSYEGVYYILQVNRRKAGISKRIYPHIFRHSRLTHLAQKIPESVLRKFAGWVDDSTMPKVYVHLNEKDVDNALLTKVYGMKVNEVEEITKTLVPKVCVNCGERNPIEYDFCFKCHFPLNEEAIKTREKQFLSLLTPEVVEKLIEKKVEQILLKRLNKG
ncbi:MAG: tyrosine-type recombinase/integrase [Nitrososphaerales archaeon]